MLEFNNPFKKFCMQLGNLPASYVESTTYQELLYWLCNFLEKEVIPTVNEDITKVQELEDLFNQLQEFVNTYFDNLDVQEEINNKLDTMAQDGTLSVIISSYLAPIIENQNNKINQIDNKVDKVASGTPRGAFTTEQDLINGDPSHNYIYVVSSTNKWYYHNGTSWVAGGDYLTGVLSNNSVKSSNLSNQFYNLLNAKYTKYPLPYTFYFGGFSYDAESDTTTGNSRSNRVRFSLTVKSGILIKFNNVNNLYKYGVYSNKDSLYTPTFDKFSITDYNSSYDKMYLDAGDDEDYITYRFYLGFQDDRELNHSEELALELLSAIEIYQLNQQFNSNVFLDDIISNKNLSEIKFDNKILPFSVENVACSGNSLTYTDSNYSYLIPIKKNRVINLLISGTFNRCQFALLHYSPSEIKKIAQPSGNTVTIGSRFGKKLDIEEILTTHKVAINTENYSYLLVYFYHTSGNQNNPNNCYISASYENIENNFVEPSEPNFLRFEKNR